MTGLGPIADRMYQLLIDIQYENSFIHGKQFCICCRRDKALTDIDHRGCRAHSALLEYERFMKDELEGEK